MIDEEAEAAVIGGILVNADVFADAARWVKASDFQVPRHALIFSVITELDDAGNPITPVAVASRLMDSGDIDKVGGAPVLYDLMTLAAPESVAFHAQRVRDLSDRRRWSQLGTRLVQVAEKDLTASEIAEKAETWLSAMDRPSAVGPMAWTDVITAAHAAIEETERSGHIRGIPTGLHDLDRLIGGGLKPGQMTVVAGRPGSGKSVLATNIGGYASFHLDLPTLLVSLEMSAVELHHRIEAAQTGVRLDAILNGTMSDGDWAKLAKHAGETAEKPLWIENTPGVSVADIRTTARRYHRRHGLKLLIIDYLQLITTPRSENRQVAVAEMSRSLKLLSQELQIPVVVCAQLNRGPEQRTDRRPQLSDLRESGGIEADADVAILVHRDEVGNPKSVRPGEGDLIVAKNRNGELKTIVTAFQGHYARFASMEPDPASSAALSRGTT